MHISKAVLGNHTALFFWSVPMKLLILILACLLPSCIHPPTPTVPTGEEISRTSGEAARKNLSDGSPALYSTSTPEEVAAPVAEPILPTLQVLVYPDGSFGIDGVSVSVDRLSSTLAEREDRAPLEFLANENVPYGKLVQALEIAKSVGYKEVVLKPLPPKTADVTAP